MGKTAGRRTSAGRKKLGKIAKRNEKLCIYALKRVRVSARGGRSRRRAVARVSRMCIPTYRKSRKSRKSRRSRK